SAWVAPSRPGAAAGLESRWCSDVFLIPCWSGEGISVAFAIDGHAREIPAWTASPRPLTGARHPNADGPNALGPFRRSGVEGASRDGPALHRDRHGPVRARARAGADPNAGL